MPQITYPILIDQAGDGSFGASVPAFPGVVASGATAIEANNKMAEALGFHIEAMIADGDVIPAPAVIEQPADVVLSFVQVAVDFPDGATSMFVPFQGRLFPVYLVEPDNPRRDMLKVMYLNRDRNIAGSVQALDTPRLAKALKVQARCCRDDADGEDQLVPRR